MCTQDRMHRAGAPEKLVGLLKGPPHAETAHRALLALRIMSDKETDRLAIMRAGGVDVLVHLLHSGPLSESAEFATAVLGNLAAGSQIIKDRIRKVKLRCMLVLARMYAPNMQAIQVRVRRTQCPMLTAPVTCVSIKHSVPTCVIRTETSTLFRRPERNMPAAQAGAIEPLVQLLKDEPGEIAAELAAVVLRNLASGSNASRQAIVDAGGLWPLLSLLAMGQERLVYPMPCKA